MFSSSLKTVCPILTTSNIGRAFMKKAPCIFVHIGAYKTGTTLLQKKIFAFWPNMTYMNDLWLSYLVLVEDNRKYIISNETLYGRPWARNSGLSWAAERQAIVKALSRLFPDAQILLSLRRHSGLILSLYKQYLHEGGTLKLEQFYDFKKDRGIIRKAQIFFMDTITLLQECFERRPFVFTLEEIAGDLPGLLKKLERLFGEEAPNISGDIGAPVNRGVAYWQGKLLRVLNFIDKRPGLFNKRWGLLKLTNDFTLKHGIDPRTLCQKRLDSLSKRQIRFDAHYEKLVDSYYAEDWEKTKKFIATYWS